MFQISEWMNGIDLAVPSPIPLPNLDPEIPFNWAHRLKLVQARLAGAIDPSPKKRGK